MLYFTFSVKSPPVYAGTVFVGFIPFSCRNQIPFPERVGSALVRMGGINGADFIPEYAGVVNLFYK